MTASLEAKNVLNEVAYAIVYEQAPTELPLYSSIRDTYLANPAKYLKFDEGRVMPLAYGGQDVLPYLTIAVFPLVARVIAWLSEQMTAKLLAAGAKLGDEVAAQAMQYVHALFVPHEPSTPLFDPERLQVIIKQIDQIAKREADELGLNPRDVAIIRDALIRRLLLTQQPKGGK
jgi:chorismate mutase